MPEDFDDLARTYWDWSNTFEESKWDTDDRDPYMAIWELLGSPDQTLSALLRALALAAPPEQLHELGTGWVEDLEHRFEQSGAVGKSVTILLGANLDPEMVFRILSGIWPDWLETMGAPELLADRLTPSQIAWLINPAAEGRTAFL